jgi:hypothetical protein
LERIEGSEEQPDAALWRQDGAQVRHKPDAEEQRTQHKAQDQEGLARTRHAGRAQPGQDHVEYDADDGVAIGIANPARHQVAAEVLRALGGERGQERRTGPTADRRYTCQVEGTPHKAQPYHRKIECQLREKPSELTGRYETELVVSPQFGFIAELGIARQEHPGEH